MDVLVIAQLSKDNSIVYAIDSELKKNYTHFLKVTPYSYGLRQLKISLPRTKYMC